MKPTIPASQHRIIEGDQHALAEGLSDLFIELDVQVQARHQDARMLVDTGVFGDLELSRQRIEAADCSDTTISEIAFACGFTDISSFNRAFKRHFGATPSSLRRDRSEGYASKGAAR